VGTESGYELRHEDFVMEMPQSGERIRGREKMREFQEAFPNPPSIQLRRVLVRDRLWVAEVVSDYGGQVSHAVFIVALRDGKMFRDTRYYAEPFAAPEWRELAKLFVQSRWGAARGPEHEPEEFVTGGKHARTT
jgi:hypothetical protein